MNFANDVIALILWRCLICTNLICKAPEVDAGYDSKWINQTPFRPLARLGIKKKNPRRRQTISITLTANELDSRAFYLYHFNGLLVIPD